MFFESINLRKHLLELGRDITNLKILQGARMVKAVPWLL